jgi:hypothetical protein
MELEEISKYRWVFHILAWGYPVVAIAIPVIKDKYLLFTLQQHFLILFLFF